VSLFKLTSETFSGKLFLLRLYHERSTADRPARLVLPHCNNDKFPSAAPQSPQFPQAHTVRLGELLGLSPRLYTRGENGDATPLFGTVVKIAEILNVTLDELAGRQNAAEAEPQIKNPELHRLYQKVDSLTDKDQTALLVLMDSLVKRSRMDKVMAE
jgi:transcriptional regulator with XRE-family HTH domain